MQLWNKIVPYKKKIIFVFIVANIRSTYMICIIHLSSLQRNWWIDRLLLQSFVFVFFCLLLQHFRTHCRIHWLLHIIKYSAPICTRAFCAEFYSLGSKSSMDSFADDHTSSSSNSKFPSNSNLSTFLSIKCIRSILFEIPLNCRNRSNIDI